MPPNRQPGTLHQLRELYGAAYSVGEAGDEAIDVDLSSAIGVPDIGDEQHSAIAFTSGSTGTPTPNLKYWRTLREGSYLNARMLLGALDKRLNVVATVPPQHMWGMETSILLPLFANVAVSYQTPFFPQNIADALESLPDPRMLVSSPIHLEAFLRSGLSTKRIHKIVTSTAPLSKSLAENLEENFDTHVQEVFGCSESGMLATRRTAVDEEWTYSDTFELTMSEDGVIIAAAHLVQDVLMPDIVELTGPDRFLWLGRRGDMVNIAGKRGSLAELNFLLHEIRGVLDGIIFDPSGVNGRRDRLAALIVAPTLNISDIRDALRDKVDPVFLPQPIFLVSELPRQESGKLAIEAVLTMLVDMQRKVST